jgi:hypothetical protein
MRNPQGEKPTIQGTGEVAQTTNGSNLMGCISILLLLLFSTWIGGVITGRVLTQYLATSILTQIPNWWFALLPLIQGLLISIPLVPFAIFWPVPRYKAVFQTWLLISLIIFIYLPVNFTSETASQLQAILNILLGGMFIALLSLILWIRSKFRQRMVFPGDFNWSTRPDTASIRVILIIITLFAYPWLILGTLGSLLDTLLSLVVGLTLGICLALTAEGFLIPQLGRTSSHSIRVYLLGGFSLAVAMMILISGTGFPYGGLQILLLISIPVLGWTLIGLRSLSPGDRTQYSGFNTIIQITLIVGLAAAVPLCFIDPDELIFLLNVQPGEIMSWGLLAALISFTFGLFLGVFWLCLLLWRRHQKNKMDDIQQKEISMPRSVTFKGSMVLLAALGVLIYTFLGQPGFYGEGLFVILNDQADLSAAVEIQDYNQRRAYVYETLVDHAIESQRDLVQQLDRLHITYTPYYLQNAIQVNGGPLVRLWLNTRPEVDRVLDNPWLRPLPAEPRSLTGDMLLPKTPLWNISLIGADRVWGEFGVTGEGIIIGHSDSGAQANHLELASSFRGGEHDYTQNWYDPWLGVLEPYDIIGHGTHTLGSIAGVNTSVAPGVTWYAYANLVRNLGNPAYYMDCMQFMLAPFPPNGDPFIDG